MRVRAKPGTVKVRIDFAAQAQRAAEIATRMIAPELNSAFQDAIGSAVWEWPRETIRRGSLDSKGQRGPGYRVTSPRNIVDTGALRQSNDYIISGTLIMFRWTIGYAAATHYGAEIFPFGDRSKPKVNLPPRPWTDAVLGNIQVSGVPVYPYRLQWKSAFLSAWSRSK